MPINFPGIDGDFHFGIGPVAIVAGAQSVWQLAVAIALIGLLPRSITVGILCCQSNRKIGFRLGVNGVLAIWALPTPLITGMLLARGDWQVCFIFPGIFCLAYGVVVLLSLEESDGTDASKEQTV